MSFRNNFSLGGTEILIVDFILNLGSVEAKGAASIKLEPRVKSERQHLSKVTKQGPCLFPTHTLKYLGTPAYISVSIGFPSPGIVSCF
jgi:hypothetical protein